MERRKAQPSLDSIELSWTYSVVDRHTLRIVSVDAELLEAIQNISKNIGKASLEWSLTRADHLLQLNVMRASKLSPTLGRRLIAHLAKVDRSLRKENAMLLPGGTHPFLRPNDARPSATDPFANLPTERFDPCVQGHINAPGISIGYRFDNDQEFAKLHAAVRMLLPILPALTAASPFLEGKRSGYMDTRLHSMIQACAASPELIGSVIPEAVFTQEDYDRTVLAPIALAFGQRVTGNNADTEVLNARAAVAFFDRGVLELRCMEPQESPAMDLALVQFVGVVLKAMMNGRWVSSYLQRAWIEQDLQAIYLSVIKDAGGAPIGSSDYLIMFGLLNQEGMTAGMLWQHLFVEVYEELSEEARNLVGQIIEHGCLAQRILARIASDNSEASITKVYMDLAQCLVDGGTFSEEAVP